MKKGVVIGAVILIIIIAVVIGFMVMKSPAKNNYIINPANLSPSNSAGTNNIQISNYAFNPATLTIKRGNSVTWTNKDSMAHTITSDTGSELGSSPLSTGQTYSHTFNTVGTFDYHCSIHTSMKGTIVVQ